MPSEDKTLSRDELLAFLESYRNVIEFNSKVLDEVRNISDMAKSVKKELDDYHSKTDLSLKDVFFKFETILTLLKQMESYYVSNRNAIEDLKRIREFVEQNQESINLIIEENTEKHNSISTQVKVGWIALLTFTATAIGTLTTLFIAYIKEIHLLQKLIEYFGIK